ncbi:hypothetical protein [Micromonospora haikouensis]|uniref:hypothetical protein n=1 Tax=Micromonospora haikouensis TaxID=686309 RepID=UPI0037A2393F
MASNEPGGRVPGGGEEAGGRHATAAAEVENRRRTRQASVQSGEPRSVLAVPDIVRSVVA